MPDAAKRYGERIDALAAAAADRREGFDPDPPDAAKAMAIVREGFGPTVSLYCEARTGGSWVRFDEAAFERLEHTMNEWLRLYAACFGEELAATHNVREAAELLVDTHSASDTAQVLTGIPER